MSAANALAVFIAGQIVKQTGISTASGKEKYRAYFVNTKLYEQYREETDGLIKAAGFGKVVLKE